MVRLIERSFRPCLTKEMTSLRRASGWMKSGLLFVELEQASGERGEFEKVVLFGDGFGGPAAIRTGIAGLGVVDVEFVEDAILAGVAAFVDAAVLQAALKQPLHGFAMRWASVVRTKWSMPKPKSSPLPLELCGDGVGELLRRFARAPVRSVPLFGRARRCRWSAPPVEALHALEALDQYRRPWWCTCGRCAAPR